PNRARTTAAVIPKSQCAPALRLFRLRLARHLRQDKLTEQVRNAAVLRLRFRFEPGEELPAHNPERMKGKSQPCWTPFPISTIIVSRTGVGPWTLGLGYEASVSSSTKRYFARTTSTPRY